MLSRPMVPMVAAVGAVGARSTAHTRVVVVVRDLVAHTIVAEEAAALQQFTSRRYSCAPQGIDSHGVRGPDLGAHSVYDRTQGIGAKAPGSSVELDSRGGLTRPRRSPRSSTRAGNGRLPD
eukprot:507703-Prymnesium_polylepis.1